MATRPSTLDPTHSGGLFVGRRAMGRSRTEPGAGTSFLTRWADECLGLAIFAAEAVLVLSVWTVQPLGWLWVASQVSYLLGSIALGLLAGFGGMIVGLIITVAILVRFDNAWKLVRRAAGHDQGQGVLERLFMVAVVLFVPAVLVWIFILEGSGSMLFPANPA